MTDHIIPLGSAGGDFFAHLLIPLINWVGFLFAVMIVCQQCLNFLPQIVSACIVNLYQPGNSCL
jgi:hypothetical protein